MPIYEYKCPVCDYITEKFLSMFSEDEPVMCDRCKSKAKRKISRTSNPKFLGKGFYVTDYPKKINDI